MNTSRMAHYPLVTYMIYRPQSRVLSAPLLSSHSNRLRVTNTSTKRGHGVSNGQERTRSEKAKNDHIIE